MQEPVACLGMSAALEGGHPSERVLMEHPCPPPTQICHATLTAGPLVVITILYEL